jgi:aminoglycoside/choline kinase family phosphotransferase
MKSKIFPIAGDASFRKFYRFISNKKSKIIVYANKEKYKNLVAYTSINKFLRNNQILSPNLYTYNYQDGIIVLEDFGDITFYKVLIKQKNKLIVYKRLVDLLLKIQKIKTKNKIKNITKGSHKINKYSTSYLHKESDLFFDWYLPIYFKKKRVLSIKKKMKKILSKLYQRINFPNSYFVHRDYHAQNLMKVGKRIGIIDSQDALIGNPAYDLVSLVDDVRIKTSVKLKSSIINYFLKNTEKRIRVNSKNFLEDFNILSVQRNLKIIGIFSRLHKRDQKNKYLKLIPYTWKLLESRMTSNIFSDLKKILDENIPVKYRKKIIYK